MRHDGDTVITELGSITLRGEALVCDPVNIHGCSSCRSIPVKAGEYRCYLESYRDGGTPLSLTAVREGDEIWTFRERFPFRVRVDTGRVGICPAGEDMTVIADTPDEETDYLCLAAADCNNETVGIRIIF